MKFEDWLEKHALCPRTQELKDCWNAAQAAVRAEQPAAWIGCGECDHMFKCHDGKSTCVRLPEQPAAPAPVVLTDAEIVRIAKEVRAPINTGKTAIRVVRAVLASAIPPGYCVVPVEATDEWVEAYLAANAVYWHETDLLPAPPDKWRPGNPRDATKAGYRAAMKGAARLGEKHERS